MESSNIDFTNVIEVQPKDGDEKDMHFTDVRVFLAGTIDDGDSEDWQRDFILKMQNDEELQQMTNRVVVYNPRRDDWNSNASDDDIRAQIAWEQMHLTNADVIFMNIKGNSKSPISLLELGLYSDHDIIVVCPKEFWRYVNVEMTCKLKHINLYETIDEAYSDLIARMKKTAEYWNKITLI